MISVKQKNYNKEILWTITDKCNQKCKYCYEEIYVTKDMQKNDDYLTNILPELPNIFKKLSNNGYSRMHICGGEPMLSKHIWDIVDLTSEYFTCNFITNAVNYDYILVEKLIEHKINKLSFSLDTLNALNNDYLRGNTKKVIKNIKKYFDNIKKHNIKIKTCLQIVLTKLNIYSIKEILLWAKKIGFDDVNIQPVHITKNNEYYDELKLEKSQIEDIINIFKYKNKIFQSLVNKNILLLTESILKDKELIIKNCPTNTKKTYLFIDQYGEIFTCGYRDNKIGSFNDMNFLDDYNISLPMECKAKMQCISILKKYDLVNQGG